MLGTSGDFHSYDELRRQKEARLARAAAMRARLGTELPGTRPAARKFPFPLLWLRGRRAKPEWAHRSRLDPSS
jgi:hypothetical protein